MWINLPKTRETWTVEVSALTPLVAVQDTFPFEVTREIKGPWFCTP